MSILQLKPHIFSIGVQNPSLRVFDIIMRTDYGTTYNAYLVKGEKTALIETVHGNFFDEYLENLKNTIPLEQIDYLIFNHTEPDHSGSVGKLLKVCPNLKVLATAPAQKYLSAIVNAPFSAVTVKNGEQLDLGGVTLQFVVSPMLHWPDSMFTWCPEEKTLFTCDFLGSHYCEPRVLDRFITYPQKYESAFKGYYDAIFSPFQPFVLAGLDKIAPLGADMICPSHGPVLTERIAVTMESYRAWSTHAAVSNTKQALILYVSAYGCTRAIAETMAETLKEQGLEVICTDVLERSLNDIKEDIDRCDGLLLGTPTINRDALKPIWDVTTVIDAIRNKGKPAGVFGSYGWSGEGVPMITERLRGLKLNVLGEGLKINFAPSASELESAREYALEFAKLLK